MILFLGVFASACLVLYPCQVNHYPGAFHIGRKDRLWMHIEKQQRRLGEHVYDIMPKTYLLPKDYDHMRSYLAASPANHVIIKPVSYCFLYLFFKEVTLSTQIQALDVFLRNLLGGIICNYLNTMLLLLPQISREDFLRQTVWRGWGGS